MDLISTLETPGEFDALRMLAPNEPYFLLLGRDRLAPALVQKWADDNRARALAEFSAGSIDEERRNRELRKSTEAEAIGWSMTAFKAGDLAKKAKEQPTVKTYTGHELPEETRQRDALQSASVHAGSALNEAVGQLLELAEAHEVIAGRFHTSEARRLRVHAANLARLSEQVKPSRPVIKQGIWADKGGNNNGQ